MVAEYGVAAGGICQPRNIAVFIYARAICDVVVLCAVMRCGAKCAELNIWVKGFAFKHVERTRTITWHRRVNMKMYICIYFYSVWTE